MSHKITYETFDLINIKLFQLLFEISQTYDFLAQIAFTESSKQIIMHEIILPM